MQDIRKPYSHSKSNTAALRNLNDRVQQFETHTYKDAVEDNETVHIPTRAARTRRNIDDMDMYPSRANQNKYKDTDDIRNSEPIYHDPRTRYLKKKMPLSTWIFMGVVAALLLVALLLTFVFNKATITISPKYQDVESYQKVLTFDQNTADPASVTFVFATSSITKSKALTLSESRQVETKASGKVVIYNNFSTDPQKLIKNTRFESSTGKIYRINQSVTVPGKTAQAPGSIEVTVYADSTGIDYNSDPVDFTIPGFKGTPQFTTFFARSKGSISGGASGTVSLPSLSDINAAKDELAISLSQQIKTDLAKKSLNGYIGLYGTVQVQFEDNQEALLRGEGNTYTVTATGYLPFVLSSSLAHAIALNSVRDYSNEPVDISYGNTLTYTPQTVENFATSTRFTVLVAGTPRVIWTTDTEGLKTLVTGKKRDEFKTLMKSISSINGAETAFYPLWLTRFPSTTSKIEVVEVLPNR